MTTPGTPGCRHDRVRHANTAADQHVWAKVEVLNSVDSGSAVQTKVCSKCGPPAQPIVNFAVRDRARGNRQAMCKSCQNQYGRAHYKTYRSEYIEKARVRNAARTVTNAEFLIEYLNHHPCVDCGESDIVVLEFDHQRDKESTVSALSLEGYSRTESSARLPNVKLCAQTVTGGEPPSNLAGTDSGNY